MVRVRRRTGRTWSLDMMLLLVNRVPAVNRPRDDRRTVWESPGPAAGPLPGIIPRDCACQQVDRCATIASALRVAIPKTLEAGKQTDVQYASSPDGRPGERVLRDPGTPPDGGGRPNRPASDSGQGGRP